MPAFALPAPEAVRHLLIWHQGALGDLLLAGPALAAIRHQFPQARITALGHPERWGLLSRSLNLAAIWDSSDRLWAELFGASAVSPGLQARLTMFELALVFSPRSHSGLHEKLSQAGVAAVAWIPSFPTEDNGAVEPVRTLQSRHLAGMGLRFEPAPFYRTPDLEERLAPDLPDPGPWLAVAPGSGQPTKNWPLSHYYEVTRALAWEHRFRVVWLAGPAEERLLPYIAPLAAAQGHLLLTQQPLGRIAGVLSRTRLYLGNDSGLTHLAAAAGAKAVLALFGATDPRVWAPPGRNVRVLAGPCPQAPCAVGRKIACTEIRCLRDLTPETVLAAAGTLLRD